MKRVDVFNGDADGICALVQIRLAKPAQTQLITGVKRDIELLKQVKASEGDQITVLDISMAKNKQPLQEILDQGASVLYVDHHQAGEIPEHPRLQSIINTDPAMCTSLLVNDYLHGRFAAWAVVAAFGDNLYDSAAKAAAGLGMSASQLEQLKDLGTCINYNAYGSSLADLHITPDQLYRELIHYSSPLDFMQENRAIYTMLLDGYSSDMAQATSLSAHFSNDRVAVFILPDDSWARRVSGVYGNHLANQNPECAHAVLSHNHLGGYQVSVRAPLNNKTGADELCASFPSGGGRKAAAGINHLPYLELDNFIHTFANKYMTL